MRTYQCDQIWQNFDTLAKISSLGQFLEVNLVLGKILDPLRPIIMLLDKCPLL